MIQVIDTGLPSLAQPFSWAVSAAGLLFTAHGPVRADGTIETGDISEQASLTFENLKTAVSAADSTLENVAQVLITLVDVNDMKAVDAIYREFFSLPYPNRSTIVAQALVVPNMRIEIVAYVALPRAAGSTLQHETVPPPTNAIDTYVASNGDGGGPSSP